MRPMLGLVQLEIGVKIVAIRILIPRAWGGNVEGEAVVVLLPKIDHIGLGLLYVIEYHPGVTSNGDS